MPELESGSGGGIAPHNPDCKTDSQVFVNGTRLPAGDMELYVRKEGPVDLSRYVEGTFASPFRGEDYADAFNGVTPDEQESFDTVRVDIKDSTTDQYHLAFRGVVTGVGNSNGPEHEWQFRAQGPSFFLNKIPASINFDGVTTEQILGYVRDRLQEEIPFDVSLAASDGGEVQEDRIRNPTPFIAPSIQLSKWVSDLRTSPKTFQANKHYLSDVINWVKDKSGSRIWLEPTSDGIGFVATQEPTKRRHQAHYIDNPTLDSPSAEYDHEIAIVNNDALTELTPINTLIVKGSAKKSLASVGPFELNTPSDTFTKVKARHSELYKRAGNRELYGDTEQLSDAETAKEVQNEAKSLLKSKIDQATSGDMQALLAAPITPYDTIEALPTCNEQINPNTDPITYEVSRVHHEIRASGISQTTLNVGVHTSMDDIEIIDSWKKQT
jgi:hypothetical protein